MTSIYDDPTAFAEESIDGFVAANRNYVGRLDGGVIRSAAMSPGQVAVVIGGGSGHYPAFAGLVGVGLAAASACGNMFASPSAGQIYRVAKAADMGGGVLFTYGNYAGDVMHFDQAAVRLRNEGIDVRTVRVTDDIASAPRDQRYKRRGVAGDLPVFKIAGAAAESGEDIDEVERLARKANDRTRSLGVAFGGCTLPGAAQPFFSVPPGRMSVGLGIHGEPGISESDMPTASELAALLVGRLLDERPDDSESTVVPILNGLGTVKYDELFVLYGKVETLLTAAGLRVLEPECGELVTSLDMPGLSLTLFWPDEELAGYWSAPADTPAYRKGILDRHVQRDITRLREAASATAEPGSPAATRLGALAVSVFETVSAVVAAHEDDWGVLDSVAGDGDHGIGMRRGADAAAAAARAAAGTGVSNVLTTAGEAWSEKAGGTSGALWGTALIQMGRVVGNNDAYTAADAAVAARAFCSAVIELGSAEVGDKTMVDAVVPFADVFGDELDRGSPVRRALIAAAAAAKHAAEATAALRPKLGRARPLAEKSLGHPDPGAVSFAVIAEGLAEMLSAEEIPAPETVLTATASESER
ncbi:dihydroxyacetone kinase [Mycolicibacterium mageritense DSM 44476 = CIP 104973]|uniref:Erythrulose kinase n=1 Tax=Mycolicibacterium mageritense TaxID=53462 RepID=A0AAI8TSS2_MYCME|nr:dihydroxyacetone kinase family protein [Mycolicibacterium mageritense]MCC9184528.1 dihydroxyacetone kinase family protein [Mycolicibacterium mageritense]BBX33230.1 erythrulose kinase [Mycolicibacterium mageritense]BDY28171.1 L-erythrulose kinase [Mycolicibacterium mageritense]CDO21663.1 dihydroxyacetone kinase [Mycolicibacterium mageritense DSM 44476 = CIP 104973]